MKENLDLIRQKCIEANPEIAKRQKYEMQYGGTLFKDFGGKKVLVKVAPIRLADVLLAIGGTWYVNTSCEAVYSTIDDATLEPMKNGWNLRADSLEEQSEETLQFLADLFNNSRIMTTPTWEEEFAEIWETYRSTRHNGEDGYSLLIQCIAKSVAFIHRIEQEARAETAKAYGACINCYGKGYNTIISRMSGRGEFDMGNGDVVIDRELPRVRPCTHCERGNQIEKLIQEAREDERRSKDGAYHERNMLVCALTKIFPAYLARHDESDTSWERDWMWIVYIDLPTGQVSWHMHDSEISMFAHLHIKENKWDGHNTERKYERLNALEKLESRTGSKSEVVVE